MSIDTSKVIEYVFLNRKEYDALTLAQKDRRRLFFIEDTGEMYKGTEIYSNSLVIVDELPKNPADSKIYIHEGKLKRFYKGAWINIELKPIAADSITEDTVDDIVTAKAVKDFINNALGNYQSIDNTIFKNMPDALAYTADVFKSKPGQIISILFNGKYSAYLITANRTLQPISSTDDLDVQETSSVEMNITKSGILSADVKVSSDDNNSIIIKDDGLYVKEAEIKIEVV